VLFDLFLNNEVKKQLKKIAHMNGMQKGWSVMAASLTACRGWWSPPFLPITTKTTAKDVVRQMPPVLRFFRRSKYKGHVISQGKDHPDIEALMPPFDLSNSDLVIGWTAAAAWIFAAWAFLWPLLGVPLVIAVLGWGRVRKPAVVNYNKDLLPTSPESVIAAMQTPSKFVVLEGPKGTGKTTVLQLASRLVRSPLYLKVKFNAPKQSDYVLFYIGRMFGMTERQTWWSLAVLRFWGCPLQLFVDIETGELNLKELTKHVKDLNADEGGRPLLMAAIASSDGKTASLMDPRMIRLSAEELTEAQSRTLFESALATDHMERVFPEAEPSVLLQHHPRTPLHLQGTLLPMLLPELPEGDLVARAEKIAEGEKAAKEFVAVELEKVVDLVRATFQTCKEYRSVLLDASKTPGVLKWAEIESRCGKDFKFSDKAAFIQEAVVEAQLFRPVDSAFKAQFDQTREAFRLVAGDEKEQGYMTQLCDVVFRGGGRLDTKAE
jgi:energy-coupling factor transporter ATP-binding protein EcfA2